MAKKIVCVGIYYDTSSKGKIGYNHHKFRAEVRVDGKRIRKRFNTRDEAEAWINEWRREREEQKQ